MLRMTQCWWSNHPCARSINGIQIINVLDNLGPVSCVSIVDPWVIIAFHLQPQVKLLQKWSYVVFKYKQSMYSTEPYTLFYDSKDTYCIVIEMIRLFCFLSQ